MSQVRIGFTNGQVISLKLAYNHQTLLKQDYTSYLQGQGQHIRFYSYSEPSSGELMANFSTITHIEVDN
ncbi:hypothetical protein J2Y86_001386 [Pseudomonas migulae]|nr:hypothetical protein [Pseudomonas migulae]